MIGGFRAVPDSLQAFVDVVLGTHSVRKILGATVETLGPLFGVSSCVAGVDPELGRRGFWSGGGSVSAIPPFDAIAPFDVIPPFEAVHPFEWSAGENNSPVDTRSAECAIQLFSFLIGVVRDRGGVLVVDNVERSAVLRAVTEQLKVLNVTSLIAIPTYHTAFLESEAGRVEFNGAVALLQRGEPRRWSIDDEAILVEVGRFIGVALGNALEIERLHRSAVGQPAQVSAPRGMIAELGSGSRGDLRPGAEDRYKRLVEQSDAIIFHAESDGALSFVSRRALEFLGLSPEELVASPPVNWFDLIHPDDMPRIRAVAGQMLDAGSGFSEEFRVVNRVSGRVRWLLTRFVPVYPEQGVEYEGPVSVGNGSGSDRRRLRGGGVVGWDGFGVDITERRETQEALDVQSKKIRALYAVSSAIRGSVDPVGIATRGVHALCDATEAHAGICYLYSDRGPKQLKLVAKHGLSERFSEGSAAGIELQSFAHGVAEHGQSIIVADLRTDSRSGRGLADEEGMRSAVLVPITAEDKRVGAIALFSRAESEFHGGDLMLVSAAASQIGLAARQATLFAAYRRQAKNLAALYRMSHELSREGSVGELFQQAFNIIRDELGLRRLWLGLLDDAGTKVVGQAAFGAGFRKQLVEINVDIKGRDHPVARVVRTRQPIVIESPREILRELGVRRVFSRLGIYSLAIVPLISRGQVLGVLAVQPRSDEQALGEEELALLSSLANEIAAILLAKRLEDHVQHSDKMRTAGLLAGGIAHNFNNLLQAILGQASLLEIQGKDSPAVARAVRVLTEAAGRGAALVKQLLSLAHLDEPRQEACSINDLVQRNLEVFRQQLQSKHKLEVSLAAEIPRAYADPLQVVRILTGLIRNAGESMPEGGAVELSTAVVEIDEHVVQLDLSPGRYLRLSVRDTGVGMDEGTRRRCFEPFFTTKEVDPSTGLGLSGAGLGLAAAYALARRNGGLLTVESRVGQGSVFMLYLPQAKELNLGVSLEVSAGSERFEERSDGGFVWRDQLAEVQRSTHGGRGVTEDVQGEKRKKRETEAPVQKQGEQSRRGSVVREFRPKQQRRSGDRGYGKS